MDCHACAYALARNDKVSCHIELSQESEISLLHCGFRDISLTLNMTKIDCHALRCNARNDNSLGFTHPLTPSAKEGGFLSLRADFDKIRVAIHN